MELQFVKLGGEWVAEFEATSDFNINLDRTNKGYFLIYLKGAADGTWATYPSYKNYKEAANIDVDVTALIYPKYIKVVSQSEVEKAIVTMEGESGGSGTGGGLRPVTADDFSSIFLHNSDDGSRGTIIFSDTITLTGHTAINIKLNNKKADLVQPVKEECQLVYSGKEQDIYYYRNANDTPTTFNMSQLYIKED